MDARVAWRDVNLSLLRGFPHASLTATDLSVSGVHAFGRDTLFATRHLRFVLDVRSVIGYLRNGRPMVIRELSFDQPVVRLRRLADGTANWNITKPGPPPTASMTEATHAVAKQVAATATAVAKQRSTRRPTPASAKARAEAERIVAEAERQADSVRAAGRALAEKLRRDADAHIDALVAKATNPIAKLAAQKAGDKLRDQTKQQTDRVVREADARADSIVSRARQMTVPPTKPTP